MKIIEEPPLAVKRKWPWLIDMLLYPASLHGVIQIGIFLFLSFLIGLLNKFILSRLGPYAGILSLVLYTLLIGYISYYFGYCIFDSAKGGRRAPDVSLQSIPQLGDLISQVFLVLGCVAVCFCPASIYYVFAERTDLLFWLLSAGGIFFFPMALLVAVLFDSFNALNPISIVGSIFKAFLPYCGLVLFFCVPGGLVYIIISNLPKLRVLRQIPFYISMILNYLLGASFIYHKIAFIYLAMVAAHLLGSFYWWHKDKLDWGL